VVCVEAALPPGALAVCAGAAGLAAGAAGFAGALAVFVSFESLATAITPSDTIAAIINTAKRLKLSSPAWRDFIIVSSFIFKGPER
jgi:hypothetical protein